MGLNRAYLGRSRPPDRTSATGAAPSGAQAAGSMSARRGAGRASWVPADGRSSSLAEQAARLAAELAQRALGGAAVDAAQGKLGKAPARALRAAARTQQHERGAGGAADDERGCGPGPVARVAHRGEFPSLELVGGE